MRTKLAFAVVALVVFVVTAAGADGAPLKKPPLHRTEQLANNSPGGRRALDSLFSSAETYLQTWDRASNR